MATKLQFGIIGLGQSGKTTVFNALSGAKASVGDYSSGKAANIATVKIPDKRIKRLQEIFNAAKKVYGEIEFIDIAGMAAQGKADRKELAGKLDDITYVHTVRMAQALLIVVRCFKDDNIPHPAGSVDPKRDIEDIESEMMLIDLIQIEKRMEKLAHLLKVRPGDEQKRELELMERMKGHLEKDIPLREMEFSREDDHVLSSFRFLSYKPALYLLNVDESQIEECSKIEREYFAENGENKAVTSLCGKLEMEIEALDEADRGDFLADMGIDKPASERVIRKAFDLLGYITFLTGAENEVRAWPVPDGYTAYDAAGEIHTDMQRGFIKAETVHFDELDALGDWNAARPAGKLRLEGKDYLVRDGDVILFRFNV